MTLRHRRRAARRWLWLVGALVAACAPLPTLQNQLNYDSAITAARREGRVVQAVYLLEAQAARDGWTAARLRDAADLWALAGDPTQALMFLEAAAQAEPDQPVLIRTLAQFYLDLQRWPQAVDALSRYAALRPGDAWPRLQLGLILAASNPVEAEDHLRAAAREPGYAALANRLLRVLQNRASDPLLSMRVGLTLFDEALWPYAEHAFRYAGEAGGPYPLALAYAAYARDRQGKESAPLMEEAVAAAPEDPQVRFLQGLHLRHMGDNNASLAAFVEAVTLAPDNPAFQAELATAYRLVGDLRHAEYWLASAARTSNGDPRFEALLAAFYAAEADHLTASGVEAFAELRDSAADQPDVRAALGWALHRAGKTEEGLNELEAVLDDAPENAAALYNKARILADTGAVAEARTLLEQVAGLDSPLAADAAALLERLGAP